MGHILSRRRRPPPPQPTTLHICIFWTHSPATDRKNFDKLKAKLATMPEIRAPRYSKEGLLKEMNGYWFTVVIEAKTKEERVSEIEEAVREMVGVGTGWVGRAGKEEV